MMDTTLLLHALTFFAKKAGWPSSAYRTDCGIVVVIDTPVGGVGFEVDELPAGMEVSTGRPPKDILGEITEGRLRELMEDKYEVPILPSYGRYLTEPQFRDVPDRVKWLQEALKHPYGQDTLSVIATHNPATLLGRSLNGTASVYASAQASKDEEKKIIGQITGYNAVWDLLTRRLPAPVEHKERQSRRGGRPAISAHRYQP